MFYLSLSLTDSRLTAGYGLRSILMTSLGGMGMGLCAQAGYDGLQEWRRRKAIQIYYEDVRGKTSLFDNWTLVSQSHVFIRTPMDGIINYYTIIKLL